MTLRQRTYRELNPERELTVTARLLIALILAATLLTILQTEPAAHHGREQLFFWAEAILAAVFGAEYVARIWSAAEGPCSRWRYASTPAALVDLIVVVASVLTLAGLDLMLLRLLRMVRLAKLARYSSALRTLERAVRARASHLLASLSLALVFLLVSATIMYAVEGHHQPEQFGSIPRALWWSVATMTTVGYGDAVPQTALGKLLGGLISLGGIVFVAIPTGIMAAAFSDQLAAARKDGEDR